MTRMSVDTFRRNLTNPARVYLWEILMPNPVAGDPETLMLRCRTTVIPGRSVGEILIPFKQSAGVKFPGKLIYPHVIDLTFVEGEDREIFRALYDMCQSVVHDKYNVGSYPVDKRNFYLHLIDTDGTVSMRIRLIGCYCQEVVEAPLSWDTEAELNFTGRFSYDRWELV